LNAVTELELELPAPANPTHPRTIYREKAEVKLLLYPEQLQVKIIYIYLLLSLRWRSNLRLNQPMNTLK